MIYTLNSGTMKYEINGLGAELQSAKSECGFEYIWQGGEVWQGHSPILFPLCGRLKDNKYTLGGKEYYLNCHGFYPYSTPEVAYRDDKKIIFLLNDSDETRAAYPFKFSIEVTFEAICNTLSVTAKIKNRDEVKMPFMFGAHPAINLPLDEGLSFEDYRLYFGKDEILINPLTPGIPFVNPIASKMQLTSGEYTLNEADIAARDTLVLSDTGSFARLYSPKGNRYVEITFSDGFKYLCLWKMPTPEAKYICVEPWSGIPQDGLTDEYFESRPSMVWLDAGSEMSFNYTLKFYEAGL